MTILPEDPRQRNERHEVLQRWGIEEKPPSKGTVDIPQRIANETTFSYNVAQDVVTTTKDKLRLVLNEYLQNFVSTGDWLGPLALFVGIILQISTADFKTSTFGVAGVAWETVFVLLGLGAFLRTVWVLLAIRRRMSVEQVVDRICDPEPRS